MPCSIPASIHVSRPPVEIFVSFDANYNAKISGATDVVSSDEINFQDEGLSVPGCITIQSSVNPTITFASNTVLFYDDTDPNQKQQISTNHQFRYGVWRSNNNLTLNFVYYNQGCYNGISHPQSSLGFLLLDNGKTVKSDPIIDNGSNSGLKPRICPDMGRSLHHQ